MDSSSSKTTVKIEKIINECLGLSKLDNGKIVFVPGTLSGEVHEIIVTEERKSFNIGRSTKLIEASPLRIIPACPFFGSCGGCDIQYARYEDQLIMKREIVEQFLEKDGLSEVKIDVIPAPKPWEYRNTAVFHVQNGKYGFYAEHSHNIVPIKKCLILEDGILEKMSSCPANFRDGEVKIRKDTAQTIISSFDKEKTNAFTFMGQTINVWIKNFFQANTALIPLWLERIAEYVEPCADDEILDLYSGIGIISLFLSTKALKVAGIEQERAAVKRAIINSWVNSVKNCYFFSGPVEKLISKVVKCNKAVFNPPRDGVDIPGITEHLTRLAPKIIVYSSCNASTFFRDRTDLANLGYRLTDITLADMFPQTRHFELIARFILDKL